MTIIGNLLLNSYYLYHYYTHNHKQNLNSNNQESAKWGNSYNYCYCCDSKVFITVARLTILNFCLFCFFIRVVSTDKTAVMVTNW